MNVFLEYLLQNWALILILLAFVIMLRITVFLDKHTVIRMYVLIAYVFLLSICVYTEFHLQEIGGHINARLWMMFIRYSSTPIILSLILFALVKRAKWHALLPAGLLAVVNLISIWTGIVFGLDEAGGLVRGALGYLPYIGVGVYSVALVYLLIKQSNKQATEIIPIVFMAATFATGLVFPFVMGREYSKIFCASIGIGLFVYYVFLILLLTKKDALTGLLNRQAYYAALRSGAKDITAFISIDMNGLKTINDNEGHVAGDEALTTLALCFTKAARIKQSIYRMGGDEFVIICRKTSEQEVLDLIRDIKANVSETKYTCSIGYCYAPNGQKDFEEMVKESDQMMYAEKAAYYSETGNNRRTR